MMRCKAAVIGSGFGGIAAAIRLQCSGIETVIYEKRDRPGGQASVYKDRGFTFDAGPSVISSPKCFEELFELCGERMSSHVVLTPLYPLHRLLWDDGYCFDHSNDQEQLKRQIISKSPEDWENYLRLSEHYQELFQQSYEKLAHVPFTQLWQMVKLAPAMIKLSAFRSHYSTVAKYINDEHLRQCFSFHSLLIGASPFASPSVYSLGQELEKKMVSFFPTVAWVN